MKKEDPISKKPQYESEGSYIPPSYVAPPPPPPKQTPAPSGQDGKETNKAGNTGGP